MKLERKINDLKILFNNKQYGKLIFEIDSNFKDYEINNEVLLILGLARMKSPSRNFKDFLLALENFKKGYILDKKSKIGLECLRYYFYGVSQKIEQENALSPGEYDEIKSFFLEAIYLIKGKSTNSKDATLYAGVAKDSKRSTAVSSKGEENRVIPFSFAQLNRSACHSNGVYASL